MRKYLILTLIITCTLWSNAQENKNLLEHLAEISVLKQSLLLNQKWVPYPTYNDRKGWDKLTGDSKNEIIQNGERLLDYKWRVVQATDYLDYERTGSRGSMESPFGSNNSALANLVLAELAEGKGRFIDQIINGVWQACEMTSWALSAHLSSLGMSKRSLADNREHIIDLGSGDMGSFFAWTHYFLKEEFDKVNPVISERLRKELKARILDTYMKRSDFWWQAFDATPTTLVNNWNPWCNFNVLTCFLLIENDPEKLSAGVYRTMVSADKFINYTKEDGACEEGPSYWGHAAGKLYDYLQLLSTATSGKISVFDKPIIKNMGEYIIKSYVGNGWVVNFADASAKGGGDKGVIFRYGKAVGSLEMQQFASHLYEYDHKRSYYSSGHDLYRTLENLRFHKELVATQPSTSNASSTWYPQTEFCYMRNQSGFFLAAKGGYNNESHNHNDVGTFSLYLDNTPMIIDAGVGTYTRQTFSSDRYMIWTMQSDYHNLPRINGFSQSFGGQFRSKNAAFDANKSVFSLDISGAYPSEADIDHWVRRYSLKMNELVIEDDFKLKELKAPNQLNFLTWSKPDISSPGMVTLIKDGITLKIKYDVSQFNPVVETVTLKDSRLSHVWGNKVYRLSLNAKKKQLSAKYKLILTKN